MLVIYNLEFKSSLHILITNEGARVGYVRVYTK